MRMSGLLASVFIGSIAPCFASALPSLSKITCDVAVSPMTPPWSDEAAGGGSLVLDLTKASDLNQANLTFRNQEVSVVVKSTRNVAGNYSNYEVLVFDEHNPKPDDVRYYFSHILSDKNQYFSDDAGLTEYGDLNVALRPSNGLLGVRCRGTP